MTPVAGDRLADKSGSTSPRGAGAKGRMTAVDARRLISEVSRDLRPLLATVDVADLVVHNIGYGNFEDALGGIIDAESGRYIRALQIIRETVAAGSVLDLGTFIPMVPVALARLGYEVTIVERFSLYGPTFGQALESIAAKEGVRVVDMDLSSDDLTPLGSFDVVMLMAVLEHLNGSPMELMRRIRAVVAPGGRLAVEVPNIAELAQRLRMVLGRSPLPEYGSYLASAYPYAGHNREMTTGEVRELLAASGFELDRLEVYDYVAWHLLTPKGKLLRAAKRFIPADVGESIIAIAR